MPSLRAISRQIHLWSGLSLGLLLAVLCLTGAALVFYIEIDSALNPLELGEAPTSPLSWESSVWDDLVKTAHDAYPDPKGAWAFEVNGIAGPIPARFYPSQEHDGHHSARQMVWFSPDGKQVLRSDTWGQYTMSWIYELHMHLLSGETGRLVVGWGGLATVMLLISGLINWWPRGNWLKALSFKRKAVFIRRLRDLHKHAGLWSAPLLLLLILTGVLLALPGVKNQLLTTILLAPDQLPQPANVQPSDTPVPLTQALDAARAVVPGSRLAFVDVPTDSSSPYRMRVQVTGDPHYRFPGSFVFVDRFSGKVLAVQDISKRNISTRVSAWFRPIHDGSIAGLGTQILAIVLGILPTVLLMTGFLYWRERRNRKKQTHIKIKEVNR